MKRHLLLLLSGLVAFHASAQLTDSLRKELLPHGLLFRPVILDPIQPNFSGSINMLDKEGVKDEGYYLPFAIGGSQSLVRWNNEITRHELAIDMGAFGQFEWKKVEGTFQRNLINTDFKISFLFNTKWNDKHSSRVRGYHISSHLGDDYMIRYKITSYSANAVNYEQLDITHAWQYSKVLKLYAAAGGNIRPSTIRKRLFFELGFEVRKPLTESTGFFFGSDCRSFQQNDFSPGINTATGITLNGKSNKALHLLLQWYTGSLPYSQYEGTKVSWFGMGVYLENN